MTNIERIFVIFVALLGNTPPPPLNHKYRGGGLSVSPTTHPSSVIVSHSIQIPYFSLFPSPLSHS